VVLVLDNATIHHYNLVLDTARSLHVNVLFLSQYSPWLNPVEALFGHLKRKLKDGQARSK
jgi:transposase